MAIVGLLKKTVFVLWTGADTLRKVLHLLLLLSLFGVMLGALSGTSPVVPSSGALVIQPAGALVEQLEGDPYDRAFAELLGEAEPQTLLQDVIDGLEYASEDDRIKAVVLDLRGFGGAGLAKLQRAAVAVDQFRESGKPVIATADFYSQGSYYLAAHADEVFMHSDGLLLFEGFGAYRNYYRSAIDKLKVDWNVFRAGTHKTAFESFTRDDMSAEAREDTGELIRQLWDLYQRDIVAARDLEDGAIDVFLETMIAEADQNNGDFAGFVVNSGFVDELLTREQVNQRLIEYAGEDKDEEGQFSAAPLGDYLAERRLMEGGNVKEENIAIVVASGVISNGSQPPGAIGGDSTAGLLRRARRDDSVKAVVLRIDSPGGSTFASEVIRNEVDELRSAGKPVVASMGNVAASGGYYIAMSADRILANPATITGSIGVLGMFPTFQRALDTLGISTDGVATSPWAGQFRPDRAMSDDSRALYQHIIDRTYDDFISRVAESRGLEKSAVDDVAQGKIWTSTDAVAHGLIDGIGSLPDAVTTAAELAELEEGTYGEKYIQKEMSPTEQLAVELFGGVTWLGLNPASLSRRGSTVENLVSIIENSLSPLLDFNDPMGIYSHCFCDLD